MQSRDCIQIDRLSPQTNVRQLRCVQVCLAIQQKLFIGDSVHYGERLAQINLAHQKTRIVYVEAKEVDDQVTVKYDFPSSLQTSNCNYFQEETVLLEHDSRSFEIELF